ncbi:MAG TPA: peptide chain release factor-like protein [Victivallales bacterium]|nr:peptide chain release factor-like protein [Victivallales bacterium]HRR06354.1 peptide chain release factor-like protein [Victivallales bacterium]
MSDSELLKNCEISMLRRTGKGGQKVNKCSSSVRLKHIPTKITVISSESRYQAENRSIALKKLRRQIAFQLRAPTGDFKINFPIPSLKNPNYPQWIAKILDVLEENSYSVSDAAAKLAISTGQLIKLLSRDPELCQKVNIERKKFFMKPLNF